MKTGMGLALIAVGAILAFAVTTNTSVFNLHTAADPRTRDLTTEVRPVGEQEVIEEVYDE
jgi:hypothetical protein